ncbi:metallophosphoesterase family protein [Streptomyces iconiensis]|uniref:Metallophosphoesterase family protein n=1 Tax=Streptomyces iconiensis TaxID=1384038 RepID=A0ABT7AA27_9ACTN|nr:metallophosphoesterase family protein [Streptomyces iconiensis]MDJ1138199.1 metallophosphoesterase family protein [Streptomyces iconiensis]
MVRRVAVLADVHGVLPALEAVLGEPEVREAERVVLAGDLAAGPLPVETLDLLATLGERAVWIKGNGDRELVEGKPSGDAVTDWAATQLRPDQRELLATLPPSAELEVAGLGRVLFCHATPRDDAEFVLVDSSAERWAEVLAGVDTGVGTVVCGHTHMPFVRTVHGRTVVNPGSVGMPYGQPGAHWALLGPGVELRRTRYDFRAARARVSADSRYPDAHAWAETYLADTDIVTAEQATAVFGRAEGR